MREDSPPVSLSNSALAAGWYMPPAASARLPAAMPKRIIEASCMRSPEGMPLSISSLPRALGQSAVQPALKGHVGAVEDIPGAAAAVRAYYPHAVIGKPP